MKKETSGKNVIEQELKKLEKSAKEHLVIPTIKKRVSKKPPRAVEPEEEPDVPPPKKMAKKIGKKKSTVRAVEA